MPTPDGSVSMNLPAGIKSGQTLRLRGKGWPKPKGGRTDLLVTVIITPPTSLSDGERELYERLQSMRSEDPRRSIVNITL